MSIYIRNTSEVESLLNQAMTCAIFRMTDVGISQLLTLDDWNSIVEAGDEEDWVQLSKWKEMSFPGRRKSHEEWIERRSAHFDRRIAEAKGECHQKVTFYEDEKAKLLSITHQPEDES